MNSKLAARAGVDIRSDNEVPRGKRRYEGRWCVVLMFFPNSQIRLLAKYPGTFFPSRDKIESKTESPYMFQYAYLAWLLALRYFDSGKGIIECTWVNQETSVLYLFMFLIISKSGFSTLVTQRCTGQPGAWLLCQQSYLLSYLTHATRLWVWTSTWSWSHLTCFCNMTGAKSFEIVSFLTVRMRLMLRENHTLIQRLAPCKTFVLFS